MDFFGTYSILLYLALGVALGATVFPKKWLSMNNHLITFGLSLALFAMGVSLGGSPTFFADVAAAGGQAAVFAIATTAGSTLLVWFLAKLFLRGRS